MRQTRVLIPRAYSYYLEQMASVEFFESWVFEHGFTRGSESSEGITRADTLFPVGTDEEPIHFSLLYSDGGQPSHGHSWHLFAWLPELGGDADVTKYLELSSSDFGVRFVNGRLALSHFAFMHYFNPGEMNDVMHLMAQDVSNARKQADHQALG